MAATGAELLAQVREKLRVDHGKVAYPKTALSLLDGCVLLTADEAEKERNVRIALEGTIEWMERTHGGDPSLSSEEYYITVEFARKALAERISPAGKDET